MFYQPLSVRLQQSSSPPWIYSATEPVRGAVEALSTASLLPWLLQAPTGDRHAVMVLPGFAASDWSTTPLRRYLGSLGYRTYGWSLGRNTGQIGLQGKLLAAFLRRSDQANAPISLIGQSLGGVFARELARHFPDRVRQVITLGSPFGRRTGAATNPLVRQLFLQLSRSNSATRQPHRNSVGTISTAEPPPVPCTAIYSRFDGVVGWQSCLEQDRPNTSNIEVFGSHVGMALHPAILHAIADRLACPADAWKRFDRNLGLRALIYAAEQYAAD